MALRGSSGVLETSLTTLNALHGTPSPLKKRKLSHGDCKFRSSSVFCIKGLASSLSDDGYTLEPITLLPRSKLPLTWLDSSTPLEAGGLFAANNTGLDDDLCAGEEPIVLAARLIPTRTLYVVERVKVGIYALCRLSASVNEGDLLVAVKGYHLLGREPLLDASLSLEKEGCDWREFARLEGNLVDHEAISKRNKFDISVVFGADPSNASHSTQTASGQPCGFNDECSFALPLPIAQQNREENQFQTPPEEELHISQLTIDRLAEITEEQQSPESLLHCLRAQYLEALYVSKTSVAYFAKGPLTRCRSAFQVSSGESGTALSDLLSFLRDAILPVKRMDHKYKETLPTIIRNVALAISEDESTSRPRKRRSKKRKLGKNGLYPEEESLVQKWWRGRNSAETLGSAHITREEETKRHSYDLRLRETQLQILLILETISLEAVVTVPAGETPNGGDGQEIGAKKARSRKSQDLNVLLELLLDRLCIWHAVSAEDAVVPDSAKETEDNHLSGKKIESDMLRDFCTEVIIPFYASRLPEQCKSITRKFGGPHLISPARPTSQAKSSSRPQPGAAIKRPQPQKPRRTLQRVLTDEKTAAYQRARKPSLARSSTAPSLQEVKRESVEPLLPSLSASVRGGIQIARRVDNREVDLNAVAKQHESKLKKVNMLMEQKRELDAAIHALRKPNRELVAKEIADLAGSRASGSRKSKNPVRNPFGQGVQVMATPKRSRKKDVNVGLPPASRVMTGTSVGKQQDTSPALGSDISMVPVSTVRFGFSGAKIGRREVNSINETPSRRPSRLSKPLESMIKAASDTSRNVECSRALFKVPNLPIPRSTDSPVLSTPLSSGLFSSSHSKSGAGAPTVQDTPPRAMSTVMPSSPAPDLDIPVKGCSKMPMTPEKSIYEQLGWDDDELALE